ncbi:hypothetical protein COCON_G00020120 [Conger conger]|uniref:Uncharacterized protein n=1 Tax=Conger conger TaxID=82655 RepID=A0A9Q1DWP3_CONCO|nr:hypothetical protein COCON_G00020120 [Conger conger]
MSGTLSPPAVTAVGSVAPSGHQGAAVFRVQRVEGGAPLTLPLSQRSRAFPLARPAWAPPTTRSTACCGRRTSAACRRVALPLSHDPAPRPLHSFLCPSRGLPVQPSSLSAFWVHLSVGGWGWGDWGVNLWQGDLSLGANSVNQNCRVGSVFAIINIQTCSAPTYLNCYNSVCPAQFYLLSVNMFENIFV